MTEDYNREKLIEEVKMASEGRGSKSDLEKIVSNPATKYSPAERGNMSESERSNLYRDYEKSRPNSEKYSPAELKN